MKKILIIYILIMFIASCADKQNAEQDTSNAKDLFTKTQGEELIKTSCITCHSLRYIEMQPPFPRKTWEKIVDKMIKNFGAPVQDSTAKLIVDYLVTVKGK